MTIDELKVVITAQNQDFNRKIDAVNQRMTGMIQQSGKASKAMNKLSGTFSKVAKVAAAAFSIRAIYNFGKQTSEIARTAEANLQRVNDIFGSSSAAVKSFADQNRASLGMSRSDVYQFSATYGNLFSTFMSSQQENAAMTQEYLNATAVVASKTGRTVEDVAERMRSGLLGNTEAIEDLGINVNIKTIEITDAFKRIANGRSWEQLNAYEQAQVRQLTILEQATNKYGTTVANNSSFAFQQASAAIRDFQTIIGNLINTAIVPLVNLFTELMTKVNSFLEVIFGKQIAQQNQSATATENNAAAMSDLADQTEQAGKAAKGALAPFDELNVISASGSNNVSSSGIGENNTGDSGTNISEPDTSKWQIAADKIKGMFDGLRGWLDSNFKPIFTNIFSGLDKNLEELKKNFKKAFSDIGRLFAPLKKWFTGDFTKMLQSMSINSGMILSGLFETFNMVFSDIWDVAVFPLAEKFSTVILPMMTQFGTELSDTLGTAFGAVKTVFDTVWQEGIVPVLGEFTKIWSEMWDGVKTAWDKWGAPIFENIRLAITNIKEIALSIWGNFLKPLVDTITQSIDWLWTKHLKPLWDNITDFIGELVNGALEIYNKFIAPIVKWFSETFGPVISNVFGTVWNVISTVIGFIADIFSGIITTLKGVVQFITGVFTGNWDKAWEGIKNIFKGVWDALVGIVKLPINLIIDIINGIIGGIGGVVNGIIKNLNKISFDLPGFLGGGHVGFDLKLWDTSKIKIPKLASGGIVSAPTLAMIGEYSGAGTNPEIVSPQSTMRETFIDAVWPLVDAILEGTDNVVRAINEKDTSVYLDSSELSARLYDPLNRERTRRGNAVIAY